MKTIVKTILVFFLRRTFNKLFALLDKNGDGKISHEECLEIETFIKEQYTKFKLLIQK